ncbi:LOB domain-containing protein 27-like isoform X2 [Salvia splendens]|uniref:LOB domain-containing protein 27-like isoform X2 n=1 Tax=Salvia splendens TaxID=180675 RepID=UPI001C276D51|nr:LOB domain-containing protein 27-like isoform X2 [Salvia splendens]
MTVKGGTTPACAACKYQRRKCSPACPLAPYFPANQPKMFQNVHRLFGVSNVTKILEKLTNKLDKDDAMRSIIYESDMRERFPVAGCCGVLAHLQQQLIAATKELEYVNAALQVCRNPCREQMVEQGQMAELVREQQQLQMAEQEQQQQQHIVEYGGEQFVLNDGADMMSVIRAFGMQTDVGFDSEAQQLSNDIFDHDRKSYYNPTSTIHEEFESSLESTLDDATEQSTLHDATEHGCRRVCGYRNRRELIRV